MISEESLSEKEIVRYSGYFDQKYYLDKYPDVSKSLLDPLSHYMKYGVGEIRNPSSKFDSNFYKIANAEFPHTIKNPIVHYIIVGKNYGALKCRVLEDLSLINNRKKSFLSYWKPFKVTGVSRIKLKKIIFFTHNLNFEGASLVCKEIVQGLKEKGDIDPIVFSPMDGPLRETYENIGVDVVVYKEFNKDKIKSLKQYKKSIQRMMDKVKRLEPDILYGNTILSFWVAHVANQLKIPSILHVHESEPINYHVYSQYYDFVPLVLHAMDITYRVVFVSDNTKLKYNRYNNFNNFTVIKNSFDKDKVPTRYPSRIAIRNSLGIDSNDIVFLNIATVTNRKGQIDIVNAVQQIDGCTLSNIHFLLIGDVKTAYSRYLHLLVGSLQKKISCRIHFIEKTADVFGYYNVADVFIMSSRIESYPKVIQEAMFFSLPIISTPIDGVTEQIDENISGLFYQAGDINKLSALIEKVAKDQELRRFLGKNARFALNKMISPKEMLHQFLQIFKDSLKEY